MSVNPLPPQAYTKETLQKAYTWLLTQTPSVKEMATSQEMLVSLYLRAQRNGDAALETPSIQSFKQELKSLASMMGELQTPAQQAQAQQQMPSYPTSSPSTSIPPQMPSVPSTPAIPTNTSTNPIRSHIQNNMPQTFMANAPASSGSGLDDQSLQAIQDVKYSLNLSTDVEALRALISLGYRQFKKM
jgi:hypothetical protein